MKSLHKYLLALLLFIIVSVGSMVGQTTVYFRYDNAGNRTLRTIDISKAKKAIVSPEAATSQDTVFKAPEIFEEKIGSTEIKIYPNPTRGQLRIDIEGHDEALNSGIYLYNLAGSLLISKIPANTSNDLDLINYPLGTYILKIVIDDKKCEWKIIKE